MHKKRLILRLSSLGDIILASSVLQIDSGPYDWVIASEFSELLEGHPSLGRIWKFDRSGGVVAWVHFCRRLWKEEYTEVYDLHRSLRTRLLKLFFLGWSFRHRRAFPLWKTVSKQRTRMVLYFGLKSFLPASLRPLPWIQRFSSLVQSNSDSERSRTKSRVLPNLKHLVQGQSVSELFSPSRFTPDEGIHSSFEKFRYLAVMPSSKWDGKKWPIAHYVELFKKWDVLPVILGTSQDRESQLLCEALSKEGIRHWNGVGRWNLRQTAAVLAFSQGYLGSDTGLAHLAQAVGVPAQILFGPTTPELGFGPWTENSSAIEIPLGCRPCSKDGRFCYRFHQRYECLRSLSPDFVLDQITMGQTKTGQIETGPIKAGQIETGPIKAGQTKTGK